MSATRMRSTWLLLLWALSGGLARAAPEVAGEAGEDAQALATAGPPLVADAPMPERLRSATPCSEPGSDDDGLIDKVQRGVYSSVCGTATWFDGLFGNARFDRDTDETFGRLGVFENYDRRDEFDTRVRLRARYSFPNLNRRLRLTLGRGDEQSLVESRPGNSQSPAPSSFQSVEDDAWLLGLGYSRRGALENGFDFGVGMRLNTPVDPYAKVTYRYNVVFRGDTLLRFRETPFWRDSRGWGATTQVSLDHLATSRVLLRWTNTGTVAQDEETEALQWASDVAAYQSLGKRRAISYTALLRGETGADVAIQNYGVDVRYRQNVFREWLFMEVGTSLTWPRETLAEERKINPGVGIGLEMYFGPVPDEELR